MAKRPLVGLYIENEKVVLAEIAASSGGTRVARLAEELFAQPVNPPAENLETLDKPAVPASPLTPMVDAVKRAYEKSGIKQKEVVLVVPEKECMIRYFEMPLIPRKELAAAIRFEAQKFIPFDLKDLLYDFKIQKNKNRQNYQVMFVAVRSRTVTPMVDALRTSGIQCAHIEPSSLATLRTILAAQPKSLKEKKESIMYLNVDSNGGLQIFVIKDQLVAVARQSQVARQAENGNKISIVSDTLLPEIQLSMNYFSKNFRTSSIQTVVMTESFVEDPKTVSDSLKNELSVTVETCDPAQLASGSKTSSEILMAAGGAMGALSGQPWNDLTLKTAAPKSEKIAVPEYSAEEEKKFAVIAGIAQVVLAGIVLFVYWQTQSSAQQRYTGEIESFSSAYKGENAVLKKMSAAELDQKRDQLSKRLRTLKTLVEERKYVTSKLSELSIITPNNIYITQWDFEEREQGSGSEYRLFLEGVAKPLSDKNVVYTVNDYVEKMNKNEEFQKTFERVRVQSLQRLTGERDNGSKFTLAT